MPDQLKKLEELVEIAISKKLEPGSANVILGKLVENIPQLLAMARWACEKGYGQGACGLEEVKEEPTCSKEFADWLCNCIDTQELTMEGIKYLLLSHTVKTEE